MQAFPRSSAAFWGTIRAKNIVNIQLFGSFLTPCDLPGSSVLSFAAVWTDSQWMELPGVDTPTGSSGERSPVSTVLPKLYQRSETDMYKIMRTVSHIHVVYVSQHALAHVYRVGRCTLCCKCHPFVSFHICRLSTICNNCNTEAIYSSSSIEIFAPPSNVLKYLDVSKMLE